MRHCKCGQQILRALCKQVILLMNHNSDGLIRMLRQDKQAVSPADTYIICHYMALLQVPQTEVEHSFMHTIVLAHTTSGSVQ